MKRGEKKRGEERPLKRQHAMELFTSILYTAIPSTSTSFSSVFPAMLHAQAQQPNVTSSSSLSSFSPTQQKPISSAFLFKSSCLPSLFTLRSSPSSPSSATTTPLQYHPLPSCLRFNFHPQLHSPLLLFFSPTSYNYSHFGVHQTRGHCRERERRRQQGEKADQVAASGQQMMTATASPHRILLQLNASLIGAFFSSSFLCPNDSLGQPMQRQLPANYR